MSVFVFEQAVIAVLFRFCPWYELYIWREVFCLTFIYPLVVGGQSYKSVAVFCYSIERSYVVIQLDAVYIISQQI